MSKVVRLSDKHLKQLEEYHKLRISALKLYQEQNPSPEKWFIDSLDKLEGLSDLALLTDCLEYAINSLQYDIQSLEPPLPIYHPDTIIERVVQLQSGIPD